jgi:hypothetical protein
MEHPGGFVIDGQEVNVCKLLMSLHVLKQAPKQCHKKSETTLTVVGFIVNKVDKCVFQRYGGDEGVAICLYVDDILIFASISS